MNKNSFIVLIVILLGFVNTLSAQPQIKDSTEAYNYWAQRGIIEMVYAYMNDYFEAVTDTISTEKKKNRKDERKGTNGYKENYILRIENEELASFETISTFLKSNSWGGTEKNLFQPLIKNYKENVNLDLNFFAAKKPGSNDLITIIPGRTNNNTNWHKKEQEIIDSYNSQLTALTEKRIQKEKFKEEKITPPVEKKDELYKQEKTKDSKWVQWIIYLAIFIFGILIGGWLVYILLKRRITKILDSVDEKKNKLESEKRKLKNNENNNYLVKSLKEENERLKRENSEFKQKESQLDNVTQKPDIEPETKNTHEWEVKQPKSLTRKLFFSMPESDGRFIVDNGESSNDGRKYFRIEYIEGSEIGELYYISGDRDKRAINRLESYLKPACDIDNITNADTATNIEFIKPGKVDLRNDSWVIDSDNKAKIKLL